VISVRIVSEETSSWRRFRLGKNRKRSADGAPPGVGPGGMLSVLREHETTSKPVSCSRIPRACHPRSYTYPKIRAPSVDAQYSSSKEGADASSRDRGGGGKAIAVVRTSRKRRRSTASSPRPGRRSAGLTSWQHAGIYQFAPLEGDHEESFTSQFNLNVRGLILPPEGG